MNSRMQKLKASLQKYEQTLISHRLYSEIDSLPKLRVFMEHHIFAVWDFMSLLKHLQTELTCTQTPWTPKGDPESRRLINEIVFGEESDINAQGKVMSHYEMYLAAMKKAGADTLTAETFVSDAEHCSGIAALIENTEQLPESVREFLSFTFEVIALNKAHVTAAVFTFGREDLIPNMFRELVRDLDSRVESDLSDFVYYLERHIELDEDEHGPLALQMVRLLCGDDLNKWQEAEDYSCKALLKRKRLWDGVLDALRIQKASSLQV